MDVKTVATPAGGLPVVGTVGAVAHRQEVGVHVGRHSPETDPLGVDIGDGRALLPACLVRQIRVATTVDSPRPPVPDGLAPALLDVDGRPDLGVPAHAARPLEVGPSRVVLDLGPAVEVQGAVEAGGVRRPVVAPHIGGGLGTPQGLLPARDLASPARVGVAVLRRDAVGRRGDTPRPALGARRPEETALRADATLGHAVVLRLLVGPLAGPP